MSTNSRLRMVLPSGKAMKPIYCHWDGYPEHQMPILEEHYDTTEKVEELLALGNISYLGPNVKAEEGQNHSFDHPLKGVTIAYHRDRDEELEFWNDRQSYNYLFDGEKWILEYEDE